MPQPDSKIIAPIFRTNQVGSPTLKPYPHQSADDAYGQFIPAETAAVVWQALRAEYKKLGFFPLLLEDEGRLDPKMLNQSNFAETLDSGQKLNSLEWIAERRREMSEEELDEGCHGEMPKMRAPRAFSKDRLHLLRENNKKDSKVFLALLPIAEPWMVPAYLSEGGWNDCPYADVQLCFHKYWYERYGAERIVVGGDFSEFFVARPPQTAKEALALAEEQFVFCYDIVVQGTGSIETLAAEIFQSSTWFFWWD